MVRNSLLKRSGMDHTVFTLQTHHSCPGEGTESQGCNWLTQVHLEGWLLNQCMCVCVYVYMCICVYVCIQGHNGCVNSIKFSPDGSWLASAGEDNFVKVGFISERSHLDSDTQTLFVFSTNVTDTLRELVFLDTAKS